MEGIIDTKKDYETNKQITRGQSVKERKKKQERRQSVVVMLIHILIYYSLVARPTVRSPGSCISIHFHLSTHVFPIQTKLGQV